MTCLIDQRNLVHDLIMVKVTNKFHSRVSKDYWSDEKVRVNCTDKSLQMNEKSLTIKVTDNRTVICGVQFFHIFLHPRLNFFPDFSKIIQSQNFRLHYILKPIIYSGDEGLRSISSQQWVILILKFRCGFLLFFYLKARMLLSRRV